MNDSEKIDSLLKEAEQRCSLFSECLPKKIDPVSIPDKAKISWKAINYREVLIWRIEELSRTTYQMFLQNELTSALTLTRACMETVAAMWYLQSNIQKVIETKQVGNIDDTLMQLLMGSRNEITDLKAINVLTFVDQIDKDIYGFKKNYLALCEFAHPNWSGTSLLYSKPDFDDKCIYYGKNIRNKDSASRIGLTNLNTALMIFEQSYSKVGVLIPDFIKICEQDLNLAK